VRHNHGVQPEQSNEGFAITAVRLDGDMVVLEAMGTGHEAACPSCGARGWQVHDRYVRRPRDLSWRRWAVRLELTVRRFRCPNPQCRRKTFAESFGPVVPRSARRTAEVTAVLTAFAEDAGGEAGARLAAKARLLTSADTLLRLLRQMEPPPPATPRVLGVDDLALRRRHRYATLLIDLETHQPVDLLDDRTADVLTTWLRCHPGVEVIARDRAEAYAEGARAGAPQAQQVADRFHLLQNASAALVDLLRSRRRQVDDLVVEDVASVASDADDATEATPRAPLTSQQVGQAAAAAPPGAVTAPSIEEATQEEAAGSEPTAHGDQSAAIAPPPFATATPATPLSPTKQRQAARRAARVARWESVRAHHAAGKGIRAIARELGLHRRTVRRLLDTPLPPRNRAPARPRPGGLTSPTLQPFVAYLQDRWQAGCENIAQLYREIAGQGYTGSRSLVYQALLPWRGPRPTPEERCRRRQEAKQRRRFRLRWLCLRPPDQLDATEHAALDQALAGDAELATGYVLLQRFRTVIATRDVAALATWLTDAQASESAPFVGLANGICADRAAVEAALTTEWSTGPVEGHVHRVKLLKRQHYGRAKLDLLRRRVLAR
jgi:transposase